MKILLLGAKGCLGSYLYSHLCYAHTVHTDVIDNKYDYFINCAGKTAVRYCEDNIEESLVSNGQLTENIANRVNIGKIIYFSSYYVYDAEGPCDEFSRVSSACMYSAHKLLGEKYTFGKGGLIFRLGKLYGHPNVHKQRRLTECILSDSSITVDKTVFNPTSLETVKKAVLFELEHNNMQGIYNLSDKGRTTHELYAKYIAHKAQLPIDISVVDVVENFSLSNYGNFAMCTNKISKLIDLTPWETCMEEYLRRLGYEC